MKAIYEQISGHGDYAVQYRYFTLPRFIVPYHFHPELELTLIERSQGKRFVGRHVANFTEGDLVLLGAYVPHCWLGAEEENEPDAAQSIVIQFREDFAGSAFLELSEMAAIRQLFQKAQAGILIKGETRDWVAEKMRTMAKLSAFQRLLQVLEVLQGIAVSEELELLDLYFSQQMLSTLESERFRKVYAYLIEHFKEDITLETIAAVANLTPTAFCRYFKKITRKTFVAVMTEIRLNHACQLLRTTDKVVAAICFESGFGNVSYFHKAFKVATGQSPLSYRKLGR